MRRLKVLVQDAQTIDAVERQKRVCNPAGRPDVILLGMQLKPAGRQARGLLREAISSHLVERRHKACRPFEPQLTAAGISYHTRLVRGEERAELLRCAEVRCRRILREADRPGWARRCLLRATGRVAGSIAGRLIHSSKLPATFAH